MAQEGCVPWHQQPWLQLLCAPGVWMPGGDTPGGTCRFVQGALDMGSCYLSRSIRECIPVTAFGGHVCDMYCLEPPHRGPHAGRTLSAGRLSNESQATPKAGPCLQSRIVLLTLLTSDGCVTGTMGRGSPCAKRCVVQRWCVSGCKICQAESK